MRYQWITAAVASVENCVSASSPTETPLVIFDVLLIVYIQQSLTTLRLGVSRVPRSLLVLPTNLKDLTAWTEFWA